MANAQSSKGGVSLSPPSPQHHGLRVRAWRFTKRKFKQIGVKKLWCQSLNCELNFPLLTIQALTPQFDTYE